MLGLDAALFSSLGSLQVNSVGLATTNHNIANVNTPGFSRQQVNISPGVAIPLGNGMIGTGVKIDSITASRDRFLEGRLNQENSSSGRSESLTDGLQQLEVIFNETTAGGIGASINSFFNAFSEVANDPSLPAARTVLVQRGQVLANNFLSVSNRLAALNAQSDRSVGSLVTQINTIAAHIADLNDRIVTTESTGNAANDLRDARGQALFDLSRLANIGYFEEANGAMTVQIGAGHSLVAGNSIRTLSALPGPTGLTKVVFNGTDITSEFTNGELAGALTIRDTTIPDAQSALDDLAAKIIEQVNAQHQVGTGLDGSTGNDFFVPFTPSGGSNAGAARAFAVSSTVAGNTDKIAASLSGAAGDNANAITLEALQSQSLSISGRSGTFAEHYGTLVARIGSLSQTAQQDSKVQAAVFTQAKQLRDSVSGVSLDEEAVNILKFQRAYQSSARVIQVVSDLLEEVVNLIR